MKRIYAVALNTFREAVRDRVLYGMLGFAVALLVFTLALAELSFNQNARIVLDLGLATISLFSVLVSIFLGSSLLFKEIERKTLYVVLPKPIRRHEFLLGKYFGITLTLVVFVLITGAMHLLVAAVQRNYGVGVVLGSVAALVGVSVAVAWRSSDRTSLVPPASLIAFVVAAGLARDAGVDVAPLLVALGLTVGEVLLLTAVALLFSSFSSPFLTGAFSLGIWIVGRSADTMQSLRSRQIPEVVLSMLRGLAEVVPNFHLFAPGQTTLEQAHPMWGTPWVYLGTSVGYACLYASVVLLIASRIFARRDFL